MDKPILVIAQVGINEFRVALIISGDVSVATVCSFQGLLTILEEYRNAKN